MNLRKTILLLIFTFLFTSTKNLQAQYDEKYRPQFHLSSQHSSMADPKGLFIFDGKYHIFWYGQWEHAISNDLLHWKELPKPMKGAPSQFSYFTGSVVVDKKNTSGFGNNSVIAFYTRHFPGDSLPETQAISISKDSGFEFHYYDKNPIIDINKRSFRDPQVFWHEPSKKWKMVVALSDAHQIQIYESGNLKDWSYCSTFGELGARSASWECPDLFELPLKGTLKDKKWVMMVGRGPNKVQYFTGDFDGKTFKADPQLLEYLNDGKGLTGALYDNFESNKFENWQIEGEAFADKLTSSLALNYLGKGYAGNLSKNSAVGRMKSKPFRINNKAINFLIAGGKSEDSLCMRLVVDGKVVRTATGDNSRVFKWRGWDVEDIMGKEAHLEIIDLKDDDKNGAIAVDNIMFAGKLLNLEVEHALWLDYGEDFYATKTYRNYDERKNMGDSVILLSWLGNWKYARISPTSWGTGFQSVPRSIALMKFPEGVRLVQEPLPVLKQLRKDSIHIINKVLIGVSNIKGFQPTQNTYEIEAIFNTKASNQFGFNLLVGEGRKLVLSYNPKTSILCLDRTNCTDFTSNADFTQRFATKMFAPVEAEGGRLKLHIFVDQSSIEVFTNLGKVVLSAVTYPSPTQTGIELFSEKGTAQLLSLKAWKLSSIWEKNLSIAGF
jgi:fructan beta-fructosidase